MNEVKILDGNTFVVSDEAGDIEASLTDPTGLFSFDTRFLSKWVLTIDGQRLNPLSVDDLQYFETRFFLVPGTGTVYVDAKLSVIRQRAVGGGFREALTILNHDDKAVSLDVRIAADSDFADLFEVKDALKKSGEYLRRIDDHGRLVLGYKRETFERETWISATKPATIDEQGLRFKVTIEPHGRWETELHVATGVDAPGQSVAIPKYGGGSRRAKPNMERSLDKWLDEAPRLECDWASLTATYRRSLVDLAALRFSPVSLPGHYLPAAGLPWFMTMFGRDSIFTSLQALPFSAELAATTLVALGLWQGARVDDFRDEDPGRILHELRFGELTAFEERPHSPYYGGRRRHGALRGAPRRVRALDRRHAARALPRARGAGRPLLDRRLRRPAGQRLRLLQAAQREDRPREPVLEGLLGLDLLPRRPPAGVPAGDLRAAGLRLRRQGARRPPGARGLEGPGLRRAPRKGGRRPEAPLQPRLLGRRRRVLRPRPRRRRRPGRRARLEHRPPAVERHRRQVQGQAVVRHLMGTRLYSGWGVRTLAEGEGRYNPIGYHVGTIWPFDNSFIAWGLRRYGFKEEAARIAAGILDAAEFFEGRLPEAFGGYPRELTRFPVQYPTACSPQAWSTGAPLLLLRAMLGLEPVGDHLLVDPALPQGIGHLELLDIPGRWGRIDAFGRGTVDVDRVGRGRRQLGLLPSSKAKPTARSRADGH